MNLENRVQAIQEAKRMTVGEVLDYLKISAPMWSMIRKGSRNPSIKTIRRIEQAEIGAGIKPADKMDVVPGDYITRNYEAEMRLDLREMKKELAAMERRVDKILRKLEGK